VNENLISRDPLVFLLLQAVQDEVLAFLRNRYAFVKANWELLDFLYQLVLGRRFPGNVAVEHLIIYQAKASDVAF